METDRRETEEQVGRDGGAQEATPQMQLQAAQLQLAQLKQKTPQPLLAPEEPQHQASKSERINELRAARATLAQLQATTNVASTATPVLKNIVVVHDPEQEPVPAPVPEHVPGETVTPVTTVATAPVVAMVAATKTSMSVEADQSSVTTIALDGLSDGASRQHSMMARERQRQQQELASAYAELDRLHGLLREQRTPMATPDSTSRGEAISVTTTGQRTSPRFALSERVQRENVKLIELQAARTQLANLKAAASTASASSAPASIPAGGSSGEGDERLGELEAARAELTRLKESATIRQWRIQRPRWHLCTSTKCVVASRGRVEEGVPP